MPMAELSVVRLKVSTESMFSSIDNKPDIDETANPHLSCAVISTIGTLIMLARLYTLSMAMFKSLTSICDGSKPGEGSTPEIA